MTSDPRWAGSDGDNKSPDYRFVRLEGYIFDPSGSQPESTLPMDSSYSPTRGDNFASSDSRWTGSVGTIPSATDGYKIYRREGYLLNTRSFDDCTFQIDERGTLPDFAVTDINRNAQRRLYVSVKNFGASGTITRVECSTLGSAVANSERVNLASGSSFAISVSVWPSEGRDASCGVRGVASDGVTPEPVGANNELTKVPTF